MADFKNVFSWSKSRNDIFNSCRRKYYYNYYGSWNGWKYDADERTRKIYRLKKLQSRQMWMGSLVHLEVEKLLKMYRDGDHSANLESIQQDLLGRMRAEYAQSLKGWPARKPWRLFEHEYAVKIENSTWKELADLAQQAVAHFWNSEIHKTVQKLEADQWLEIEEFSGFQHDGVKVHVVLDFSYREGDDFYIYDWKTGLTDLGLAKLQLACYRIYAVQQWGAKDSSVRGVEFNLSQNKQVSHDHTEFSLEEAIDEIQESMDAMRALLIDQAGNTAQEDDFALTENIATCDYCSFKSVCPKMAQ